MRSLVSSLAHFTLLDCPPPQLVELAARAGYDFVGLRLIPMDRPGEPQYDLSGNAALARDTRHALAETGVRVLDIEVAQLHRDIVPDTYLKAFEAGADLGARYVVTSGWTPDRTFLIEAFSSLCDLGRPYGLTVMLEHMGFSAVPALRDAVEIVGASGQLNAGVLVDTLHCHLTRTPLSELAALPTHWTPYIHMSDGPRDIPTTTDGLRDVARRLRILPGEGDVDLAGMLKALPADVIYAVEVANPALAATLGGDEYVRLAYEGAKNAVLSIRR